MATFNRDTRRWFLETGDLAYWVDDTNRLARCRVELITGHWVYVKFTADDNGRKAGQVDRVSRFNRTLVPRVAVRAKVTGLSLTKPIFWDTVLTGPNTPA